MALVTALLSPGVAEEVAELRRRGWRVAVFYAGDGEPSRAGAAGRLPEDVPVLVAGAALAPLEEMWREDWGGGGG